MGYMLNSCMLSAYLNRSSVFFCDVSKNYIWTWSVLFPPIQSVFGISVIKLYHDRLLWGFHMIFVCVLNIIYVHYRSNVLGHLLTYVHMCSTL